MSAFFLERARKRAFNKGFDLTQQEQKLMQRIEHLQWQRDTFGTEYKKVILELADVKKAREAALSEASLLRRKAIAASQRAERVAKLVFPFVAALLFALILFVEGAAHHVHNLVEAVGYIAVTVACTALTVFASKKVTQAQRQLGLKKLSTRRFTAYALGMAVTPVVIMEGACAVGAISVISAAALAPAAVVAVALLWGLRWICEIVV